MKHWLVPIAACVSLALGTGGAKAQEEPVRAMVTIGMIGDVVQNVGGECVEASAIMGPGVDPHLYRASARDVQAFQAADVIFYSGYSLEGQLGEVLQQFAQTKPTIAVSPSSIDPADLITVQDVYGIDPHLWMDAGLWAKIAPTIAGALGELRPDCADEIDARAERYAGQLAALDEWVRASVASIPEQHRVLVTAHDAFGYYGRAYGIEVAGIQGISTEAEASVADIRETAATVAELGVPAVFVESTINPRTVQAVIDAARQLGQDVEIGGQLYSDAMGEAGSVGGTYIGMIYENTRNIVEALGGTLPAFPEALQAWAEEWDVAQTQTGSEPAR